LNKRYILAKIRQVGDSLPRILENKVSLAVIALAIICTSTLAQENTTDFGMMKSDATFNVAFGESYQAEDDALQNDPGDYSLWINRALNLTYLGRLNESMESHQKALDLIDDILKKDPKNIDAWKMQGTALAYLGQYDDAIKSYEKAIEISNQTLERNPRDADAWWHKAESLEILGKSMAAINAYNKVIELNSSKAIGAWIRKADLSEYNDSVEAFDKATELMPKGASRKLESVWTGNNASILVNLWCDKEQILSVSIHDVEGLGSYNKSSKSYDRTLTINSKSISNWLVDPGLKYALQQHQKDEATQNIKLPPK
jgi:tetratricopeptide (TPR) repeat protein